MTVQPPVFVSPEIRRFATGEGATFTCRGDLFTGSIYTGEVTRLGPVTPPAFSPNSSPHAAQLPCQKR